MVTNERYEELKPLVLNSHKQAELAASEGYTMPYGYTKSEWEIM